MTDSTSPDRVETVIRSIGAGGAGIGSLPDGRTLFVQRTAPGDRAQVRVRTRKKRWARGALETVVEAGADRRPAACPLYARCGGCTLQHLGYGAQLEAKRAILRDALARVGGFDVELDSEAVESERISVEAVHAAPNEFHYRNRLTFTLRRSKDRAIAGFHAIDRPERIVEVRNECMLGEPVLMEAWSALRAAWGPLAQRLPGGSELRLTLRAAGKGVLLLVQGGAGKGRPDEILERVPAITSIWQTMRDGPARRLAGAEYESDEWYGEELHVRPGVFVQVNREGAEILHSLVLREIGKPRGKRVVDAYCGSRGYGRTMAVHGAEVVGIESDPIAVEEANRDAPTGFEARTGSVEDLLASALPADAVVLNPPRSGLDPKVVELLVRMPPERIVYVSCDPATLARDLRGLSDGFRLERVQAVDLFPQTAHVESVVTLTRRMDSSSNSESD